MKITHTLEDQFEDMLKRGIMPLFELPLKNEEYLIVNIHLNYTDKLERFNGIRFEFDNNDKKPCFDGCVRKLGNGRYLVPVDDCFDSLDSYLETILDNLTEGFLLVYDLTD